MVTSNTNLTPAILNAAIEEVVEGSRRMRPGPTHLPANPPHHILREVGLLSDEEVAKLAYAAFCALPGPCHPRHACALRVASARANGGTVNESLGDRKLSDWVIHHHPDLRAIAYPTTYGR